MVIKNILFMFFVSTFKFIMDFSFNFNEKKKPTIDESKTEIMTMNKFNVSG